MASLNTLAVLGVQLPPASLAKLRAAFATVHYRPDFTLPAELRPDVDMVFANWRAIPTDIALADLPKLRHIQLSTAGADMCMRVCPAVQELAKMKKEKGMGKEEGITLGNASGIHVLSIPNWVVANVIVLYHQLQVMMRNALNSNWDRTIKTNGHEYFAFSLHGRTAGMLGYGALGRETARLLRAHGMRVVAANTSGKASADPEVRKNLVRSLWQYNIPGTGDPDGSIPDKYYSTKDPAQFEAFLRATDVLVCSLPSTAATRGLLDAKKLSWLRREAPVFINVGRGDLIKSEELLAALEAPVEDGGLWGAAIDVTDPEPLSAESPLWTHPRCIITPHLSGNVEGELALGADIALANAERIRKGETPYNLVDLERGY